MASACAAGESGGDGDDPNERGKAIDEHRLDATEASKMSGAPLITAWEEAWWEYHARFPHAAFDPEQGDPSEWPDSDDDTWYVNHDLTIILHPDDEDLIDPISWQESWVNDTAFCAVYGRVEDGFDLPKSGEIMR